MPNEAAGPTRIDPLLALSSLVDAVGRAGEPQQIYELALDTLLQVTQVDRAAVLLFDPDGVIRFKAWRGLSEEYRGAVAGHSPWAVGATGARTVQVDDTDLDPSVATLRETLAREHIRAAAFVPLIYRGGVIGKFMLYERSPRRFTAREIELAETIGSVIAFVVERQRTEAALQETDRRKDDFLAALGHELRGPMASILGAAELMRTADAATLVMCRDVIQRQTRHLARLVDDLLDVSRVSRGHIRLRLEDIALLAVVARAVEATRPTFRRRRQALAITMSAGLRLCVDPVRLQQVLTNLLENAAKYTQPGGRIALDAAHEHESVRIAIRDNGQGMTPELIAHVFDLFAQGERGLDRTEGGLGIGLTITRHLVELHRGRITAASAGPGLGSEFVVWLPAAVAPASAAKPRPSGVAGTSRRVLVVEDQPDAAEMLAALLREWGHEVEVAVDGPSALEAARRLQPQIVLLDIGLPGMDGYQLARRLRATPEAAGALLVAVTGYGLASDVEQARAAGFDLHRVKPLDLGELRMLLGGSLAERSARR